MTAARSNVRFVAYLCGSEADHIAGQVDDFIRTTGIDVDRDFNCQEDFLSSVMTQIAAGTPPDVIGLWRSDFVLLQPQQNFMALHEVAISDYRTGAQIAVTLEGQIYALPWSGYLCAPDFRVLAISSRAAAPSEARALIDFLSAAAQQRSNYETLKVWYPTLKAVNDDPLVGPGCPESDSVVKRPTPEQLVQILQEVTGPLKELESTLKGDATAKQVAGGTSYWPADQPTTLNFDRATGGGVVDENRKYATVQLGAVPAAPDTDADPGFFHADNIRRYFHESGNDRLIIGALSVLDPSILDNKLPKGSYAAVWQFVDGTLENDRFMLVRGDGSVAYEDTFKDANGANVNKLDDPERQVPFPIVTIEQSVICVTYWIASIKGQICADLPI